MQEPYNIVLFALSIDILASLFLDETVEMVYFEEEVLCNNQVIFSSNLLYSIVVVYFRKTIHALSSKQDRHLYRLP